MEPTEHVGRSSELARRRRPRVLVLMATYNGASWIDAQLASVFAQRDVEVSVLVSDDASQDLTVEEIRRHTQRHGHAVAFLDADGRAGSAGRNFQRLFRGADASTFDYVALADQDDVWLEEKLSRAISMIRSHSASGYSCAVSAVWEDGRQKVLSQSPRMRSHDHLFEGAGQGCGFVLTAAFFQQVQRYCQQHRSDAEAMHYHDWLIYLLCRAWGLTWFFDEQPMLRYRQHGTNEIGARNMGSGFAHRLKLVRSGWYKAQVAAALSVLSTATQSPRDPSVTSARGVLMGQGNVAVLQRGRLACWLLRHGRRRWSDRVALCVFALAGWI